MVRQHMLDGAMNRAAMVRRGLVQTAERELSGRIVVAMLQSVVGAGGVWRPGWPESWPEPRVIAAYAVDVAHEIVERTAVDPVVVDEGEGGAP